MMLLVLFAVMCRVVLMVARAVLFVLAALVGVVLGLLVPAPRTA
jgi:hypothetical protein